ncbi:hypothetical protein GCM10010317_101880 [Streptomyces mirabilis]|nr:MULTISPECIES: hypothetical protein [Streptomyces]GHD80210.1 hypothetical protein GCM10010317_101880 [Streptomyces mirabilis]
MTCPSKIMEFSTPVLLAIEGDCGLTEPQARVLWIALRTAT